MNKTKISKIGRRGKIGLTLLIAVMFIGVASAALIPHFGRVTTTATVSEQAVQISADGIDWLSYDEPIMHTIPHPSPGGETFCYEQWILNRASIPVDVTLNTNVYEGITTSYSIPAVYSLNKTIASVGVTVEDTGDGWLLWTYTYAEVPTHTPKMTVAIDYPDGFAITTFDDGAHDGWFYVPDGGAEVRFADYVGGSYGGWVETTAVDNVLTVKILKSELGDSFHWHGYANYNGAQVWINGDLDGTGYGDPPFEVNLWQPVTGPFTLISQQQLQFRICYTFDLHIGEGTYTLTTIVDATESP